MRIHLRDLDRVPVGHVTVDPDRRPVRAVVEDGDREVFLHWDSAIDDGGHLRCCVACGCPDLFHEKAFPVITAVVVVLAFVGAVAALLGFADRPAVLAGLAVILVADVAILALSRRQLVCYRCHTAYPGEPIARYHGSWDRAVADRYPRPRRPDIGPDGSPAVPAGSGGRARAIGRAAGRRVAAWLRAGRPDGGRPPTPGDGREPGPVTSARR